MAPHTHCQLCLCARSGEGEELKATLFRFAWQHFTIVDDISSVDTENEDWPEWVLCSASFVGCPRVIDICLGLYRNPIAHHDALQVTGGDSDSEDCDITRDRRQLTVNSQAICSFPLSDLWIRQSHNLLITPLHLACWRLDVGMVQFLLSQGADPNSLAHEEVPEEQLWIPTDDPLECLHFTQAVNDNPGRVCLKTEDSADSLSRQCRSKDADVTKPLIFEKGRFFYKGKGLTPFHFLALGIRSPPVHSVSEGIRKGIIHDINGAVKRSCRLTESFEDSQSADIDHRISLCIEMLVKHGGDPNSTSNVCLEGLSPLDVLLQPPIKIYYAPHAARGNQSPVMLRRQELEVSLPHVLVASEHLFQHGGSVSGVFRSKYEWNAKNIDCFHLNDVSRSLEMVKLLIRMRIFPESSSGCASEYDTCYSGFISEIINSSVRPCFTSMVLRWCQPAAVCQILQVILEMTNNPKNSILHHGVSETNSLGELTDVVIKSQMRCLSQYCALSILKSVKYTNSNIDMLPLPPSLKRALKTLQFPWP